jgi:hypothetical protein
VLLWGNLRNFNIFLLVFSCPKAYHSPIIGLCAVLVLYLVSELRKPSSLVLNPNTNYHGCGCCFHDILNGHAMAYAVGHRPLTAEARVSPCGICGGLSGTGTGFSLSSLVFPCQYHSVLALHTHKL